MVYAVSVQVTMDSGGCVDRQATPATQYWHKLCKAVQRPVAQKASGLKPLQVTTVHVSKRVELNKLSKVLNKGVLNKLSVEKGLCGVAGGLLLISADPHRPPAAEPL